MKGKDTMKTAIWMLAMLLALSPVLLAAEGGKSPTVMYQEALYQEETEGDLDKAIELYGQVLEQAAEVKYLAARTLYQLGLCHLKKGDTDKAAVFFRDVLRDYPKQTSVVRKAKAQLEKLTPPDSGNGLYDQASETVWSTIGSMYGQVGAEAGMKNLYTNSNIHFVNSDFTHWRGGYGFYSHTGSEPISGRVRLSGTSYPNQKHYDIMGNLLDTEIVPSGKKNHYDIYLNLPQTLSPGQFFIYAWAVEGTKQLSGVPYSSEGKHILRMQNHFGSRAIEAFYLVVPNDLKVEYQEKAVYAQAKDGSTIKALIEETSKQIVGDYTIYAWEKEVGADENHVVTVSLIKKQDVSPEELKAIVEKAVLTISTCGETDPRVKESLETLDGIVELNVVSELVNYLDSETATIRRSAIFILWRGGLSDISAAEGKLLELCEHEENFTRGMAALTLGEHRVANAYETLADMTLNDKDGYARRLGAYALGLFGDPKALPVLEQALQDSDDFVKQNAQAAITMLTKLNDSPDEEAEPEPKMTQEMFNDIQPDGTIQFRNPQQQVNNGTGPITETRFINSDFVQLTAMTDEQGNPVEFSAKHEGNIYRYHVKFDPPVMPGETFVYYTEGMISGLIKPAAGKDNTYRYHMTHSPATGVPTLRIEEYLLPEGAELLSTLSDEMTQSEKDGRVLLRVEEDIPAGRSLTTSFKYRLAQ